MSRKIFLGRDYGHHGKSAEANWQLRVAMLPTEVIRKLDLGSDLEQTIRKLRRAIEAIPTCEFTSFFSKH